jgi:hypothetical protein
MLLVSLLASLLLTKNPAVALIKKKKKNSLIYKEIQKGAVAKSYSRVHPTLFPKRVDSAFNF